LSTCWEMEVSRPRNIPCTGHLLSIPFFIHMAKLRFPLTHTTTPCSKVWNLCRFWTKKIICKMFEYLSFWWRELQNKTNIEYIW
jgi:hypothetical protein